MTPNTVYISDNAFGQNDLCVPLSGLSGSAKPDGMRYPLNLQRLAVMTCRFRQEGPPGTTEKYFSAIDYVHENPVRRKLCERAVDWHWSSARSCLSGESDPDLPVIDALPPDLLDEGRTENAVRLRTAGQAGQWHPTSITRTRDT